MKYAFLTITAILVALSFVAVSWTPPKPDDRIELVWATGESPVSRRHVALFNARSETYRAVIDPANAAFEKVIVQTLAGKGPDLFDMHTPAQVTACRQAGILADVTDELTARGITPDTMWPVLEPLYLFDGRMFGHPPNAHAPAIWFNKAHFDEAGVAYPEPGWTWDDLVEKAKALTVRDEKGRALRFGFIGPYDGQLWKALISQWGAAMYNDAGTRCSLDEPAAIAAMTFAADLVHRHHVMPTEAEFASIAAAGGFGGAGAASAMTMFAGGRGSIAIGGRFWLIRLRDPSFGDLRLGAVPLPRGPFPGNTGGGRATLANATTRHREGVIEFLAFMHSEAYNRMINEEADGLAPVIRYNYPDEALQNPNYPGEDFHVVFREALEDAQPMARTPFVNGNRVEREFDLQMQSVRLGVKTAEEAMRDLTRLVNEGIVDQLELDPTLRGPYLERIRAGARPAWDPGDPMPAFLQE